MQASALLHLVGQAPRVAKRPDLIPSSRNRFSLSVNTCYVLSKFVVPHVRLGSNCAVSCRATILLVYVACWLACSCHVPSFGKHSSAITSADKHRGYCHVHPAITTRRFSVPRFSVAYDLAYYVWRSLISCSCFPLISKLLVVSAALKGRSDGRCALRMLLTSWVDTIACFDCRFGLSMPALGTCAGKGTVG